MSIGRRSFGKSVSRIAIALVVLNTVSGIGQDVVSGEDDLTGVCFYRDPSQGEVRSLDIVKPIVGEWSKANQGYQVQTDQAQAILKSCKMRLSAISSKAGVHTLPSFNVFARKSGSTELRPVLVQANQILSDSGINPQPSTREPANQQVSSLAEACITTPSGPLNGTGSHDYLNLFKGLTNKLVSQWRQPKAPEIPQECNSRTLLAFAKNKLSSSDYAAFERLYHSFWFFNPYQVLYQNLASKNPKLQEPQQFNLNGEYPYDGYLKAREFLSKSNKIDIPALLNSHRILLSKKSILKEHFPKENEDYYLPNHSENTPEDELGSFREVCIDFEKDDLSNTSQQSAEADLVFFDKNTPHKKTQSTLAEVVKNNHYLTYRPVTDSIYFPCLPGWEKVKNAEKARRKMDAHLHAVKDHGLQEDPRDSPQDDHDKKYEKLTQRAQQKQIEDLLTSEITQLNQSLKNASRTQTIESIARFYRHFVGIHPFTNGNGRTGRLLTEILLERHGINPPLNLNWGEDVLISEDAFVRTFVDGVKASDHLHENACREFSGINSLDIGPILGVETKKVGLNDFIDWAKKKGQQLPIDPMQNAENFDDDVTLRQRLKPILDHFQKSDTKGLHEKALKSEQSQVEALTELFPTNVKTLYSWQPVATAQAFLKEGQLDEDVELSEAIISGVSSAGAGIYTSEGMDASNYAGKNNELLAISIPPGERRLNLKDPKVRLKLEELGLFPSDVFHMGIRMPIKYAGRDPESQWLVYKKSLPASAFHIATVKDFDRANLIRMSNAIQKFGTPHARKVFQTIFSKSKQSYLEEIEKEKDKPILFWTPFGDCYRKWPGQTPLYSLAQDIRLCVDSLGLDYHYDEISYQCQSYTKEEGWLVKFNPPRNACEQRVAKGEINHPVNPHSPLLLPVGTARTAGDLKLLKENHLRMMKDSETREDLYQVLTRNNDLDAYLETFDSKEEAMAFLQRIPHPLNFEKIAERTLRAQSYLESNLEDLLEKLSHPKTPAVKNQGAAEVAALTQEIKTELFNKLMQKEEPDDPATATPLINPPTSPQKRTIEVSLSNQSEVESFLKSLKKELPGFLIALDDAEKEMIYPGSKPLDPVGSTLIEGFQNGIKMRIRLVFK